MLHMPYHAVCHVGNGPYESSNTISRHISADMYKTTVVQTMNGDTNLDQDRCVIDHARKPVRALYYWQILYIFLNTILAHNMHKMLIIHDKSEIETQGSC